jgi:N utilization substance protein B
MATSGRHLARRNAVQALYQWDMTGQDASSINSSFIHDERLKGRYREYFEKMIKEIPLNIEEIDGVIALHADRPVERLDPLEKAILRIGIYELMFEIDIPQNVVVNEAIEIAKLFCADNGYKYVNGVLDKVVKGQKQAVN